VKNNNLTMVQTKKKVSIKTKLKRSWRLYIMILPVVILLFVFNYMPMYGVQIAFRDYRITKGITGSEWVGLKHFRDFFDAYYMKRLLSNTLLLNLTGLVCGFPIPIILALLLNQIKKDKLKRVIQTTIYIPNFISTIVIAGMIFIFLSPSGGIFNTIRGFFGEAPVDLMSDPSAFRAIYVISGIWQGSGFGSILYIATLSSIDPTLYEAAEIDGASVWQKIRHIDIPTLIPTAMMQLILNCGGLLGSNTEKALALQTPGNLPKSDVIGTYVYNIGLAGGEYSYTTAIGLFLNVISLIMIVTVNSISKKMSGVGMF